MQHILTGHRDRSGFILHRLYLKLSLNLWPTVPLLPKGAHTGCKREIQRFLLGRVCVMLLLLRTRKHIPF